MDERAIVIIPSKEFRHIDGAIREPRRAWRCTFVVLVPMLACNHAAVPVIALRPLLEILVIPTLWASGLRTTVELVTPPFLELIGMIAT